MITLLSHVMTMDSPAPGGRTALRLQADERIEDGAAGNTFYYTLWNHAGTHADAPAHMLPGAAAMTDMGIASFVFSRPGLVDVPKSDSEMILSREVRHREAEIRDCDILLLRTGAGAHRRSDPARYRDRNPGLSAEAARYLASDAFPHLRAVGIDSISIACAEHLAEGVEAHRILFRKTGSSPFILIEDMNLGPEVRHLDRVLVVPFLVEGLDSCHCTVLGEWQDQAPIRGGCT
jgi:kynurenine formamidase